MDITQDSLITIRPTEANSGIESENDRLTIPEMDFIRV